MKDTSKLIKALEILAQDIQSGDGMANAVISEAATTISELVAHVEALRESASEAANTLGFLSNHLSGRMGESALMDMAEKADALNDALSATPQQHLAEIRAEAGRAGYFACLQKYVGGVREFFHDELADQYAEEIRKGGE